MWNMVGPPKTACAQMDRLTTVLYMDLLLCSPYVLRKEVEALLEMTSISISHQLRLETASQISYPSDFGEIAGLSIDV